jgi:hypothetical protein
MRTTVVVLVVAMVTISADAAPKPKALPGGMKVVTKAGRPYVQQGALTVALRDDDAADYEKIAKVELAADGKTLEVTATRCKGEAVDDVTKVPLAKIQAKLDNAAGLVAHGKKQYAAAISKFASALQKDPETPAYATNLLAAQLLGKKSSLAGQTLAIHGRKNPVWFAWRLGADADLAGAATLKGAQDLVAAKPGTATVAKLGERDLATSTLGGGMAALRVQSVGAPGATDVDVISLTTGKLLARLPLTAVDDACDDAAEFCDDTKARLAERTKLVDRLFASLGFEIVSNAFVDVRNGEAVSKDGVNVEFHDDAVVAEKNGAERTLRIDGSAWAVAFTAKALVVRHNRRNLIGCNDGSSRVDGVALPLP